MCDKVVKDWFVCTFCDAWIGCKDDLTDQTCSLCHGLLRQMTQQQDFPEQFPQEGPDVR